MKLTAFLLLIASIYACCPDFHRQKHTDFKHTKGIKFLEKKSAIVCSESTEKLQSISNTKDTVQNLAAIILEKDSILEFTEELTFQKDSTRPTLSEFQKDEVIPQTVSDSTDVKNYLKVLKDERNNNFILGIPALALLLAAIFTSYWILVPLFGLIFLFFLLVALLKIRKHKLVLKNPEAHPNPKDKKKYTNDSRWAQNLLFKIAIAISIITAISFVFYLLLVLIGATISFYIFAIPVGIIVLLHLISTLCGINYNRGQKLRGLDTDINVIGINIYNWMMILFLALISSFTFFYPFLK